MLRPCPKREIGRRKNTKNNCELRPLLRLFARALVHSFPRSLASRALYHDLDRQALDPRHSQLLTHAVGYHRVLQAAHHHRGREWRWQDGARARASFILARPPQPLLTHLQTVIECLNYATTGEHPPCSQKGQAFVHDPKVGAYARSAHCWLGSLVGWLAGSFTPVVGDGVAVLDCWQHRGSCQDTPSLPQHQRQASHVYAFAQDAATSEQARAQDAR